MALLFCGYFGLIFFTCIPNIVNKCWLRRVGIAITVLDVYWSQFLLRMCYSSDARNDATGLGLLLVAVFVGMNILWYKTMRRRL